LKLPLPPHERKRLFPPPFSNSVCPTFPSNDRVFSWAKDAGLGIPSFSPICRVRLPEMPFFFLTGPNSCCSFFPFFFSKSSLFHSLPLPFFRGFQDTRPPLFSGSFSWVTGSPSTWQSLFSFQRKTFFCFRGLTLASRPPSF